MKIIQDKEFCLCNTVAEIERPIELNTGRNKHCAHLMCNHQQQVISNKHEKSTKIIKQYFNS